MKQLLQAVFSKKAHITLAVMGVIASILFSFSGTLEMMSLGIITKKGPDFFQLFAPIKGGKLVSENKVNDADFEGRLKLLDKDNKGYVDYDDTERFLENHGQKGGIITDVLKYVQKVLPVEQDVRYLIALLLLVSVFKAITMFFYRFVSQVLAISVSKDLRQRYFDHIQTLPMSFYQKHNIGALSSRVVNDAVMIADAINSFIINYVQTPFSLITVLAFCFYSSWKLSMVVFLALPLLVIPIVFLARRIKRLAKQIQKRQEAFASVLIEFLAGIQTIKIFSMELFSLKKYQEHNENMAKLEIRGARYDVSSRPILHTIGGLCLVTALLFGLHRLDLPLYEVLAFCGFLSTAYEPIKKFAEENGRVQRGVAAAERLFEVLSLQPEIKDEGVSILSQCKESISFDHVSFAYENDSVLKDVSFSINRGEMLAIVGPTGAGKSTIVQLLARLYEPQSGTIFIDEKPIQEYTQSSLRDCIAFVPQKPFLFIDTVFENIAVGKGYSEEKVKEAAVAAHADEFIRELPKGYYTELQEAGTNLSGGQQQRLAIARAFIKDASILIMDEATAALDSISEQYIKESMKKVHGKTTQIVIAHRLSTIEHADKIIFIDRGRKIAEGTKQELLQTCPEFKRMWHTLYRQEHNDEFEE